MTATITYYEIQNLISRAFNISLDFAMIDDKTL